MKKTALLIVVCIALFFTVSHAMDKQEIYECHKLEKQAQEFPLFYLASWQSEMCNAHGIAINAPVK